MSAHAMTSQDPTAVVGRRILAYAIDFFLAVAVATALIVPQVQDELQTVSAAEYECGGSLETGGPERKQLDSELCLEVDGEIKFVPSDKSDGITQLFYLGYFGLGLVNAVLLQTFTGASVGKLLVGLRVIRADGRIAGIGWQALRWLLMLVDALCCFLPGAVLVFTTKGHRRIGDMAAGTFVVGREQVGTPPVVPGVTAPATPMAGYGSWGAPPTQPNAASPAAPSTEGPVWDEARNTYIQWDAPREQWVQWDETANEWRPIEP